jgi:hypothetical protein
MHVMSLESSIYSDIPPLFGYPFCVKNATKNVLSWILPVAIEILLPTF